jgi:hypothetical protein
VLTTQGLPNTPTHTCRASKISESQITFSLFSKNTFTFYSSLIRQKSPVSTQGLQKDSYPHVPCKQNLRISNHFFTFVKKTLLINLVSKSCVKNLERVMKKCRACKISGSQMTFLLFSKNTFTFYSSLIRQKSPVSTQGLQKHSYPHVPCKQNLRISNHFFTFVKKHF